jgi:hypothetical protein
VALTYVNSTVIVNNGGGTSLDTTSALNIAAGDLIVCGFGCWGNPGSVAMSDTDGSTNPMTMLAVALDIGAGLVIGYNVSATADAAALFRVTNSSVSYRKFYVWQFRPDAGETVSYDVGPNHATGTGTALVSGNLTTTGTDEVAVALAFLYSGKAFSAQQIGDVNADGNLSGGVESDCWYKLFTATQTDAHAQCTISGSDQWVIDFAAFKSAAAGGGGSVVTAYQVYYDRMRRVQ